MTTYRGRDAFYSILTIVCEAIVNELRVTPGGAPSRAGLVPGAVAWDNCETCGTLAISASRYFLSDSFPVEVNTTSAGHGTTLACDAVISMIRCAPVPQGSSTAPTVSALNASAKLVGEDAFTVMCATVETLSEMEQNMEITDYMIRQQIMVGPAGACVGSDLSVVIGVEW